MPTIRVSLSDLESLMGIKVDLKAIENALEALKGEVVGVEGDYVEVELNYDRPDLFSAEGLARALSIYMGIKRPRHYEVRGPMTTLDATNPPSYRPYAYMAIVRNVRLSDEAIKQLFQLQEILHRDYCGDRELVSIGLYDLDTLKPPFRYIAVEEAKYVPLDYSEEMTLSEILERTEKGKAYAHLVRRGEYPLLVDSEGKVLSFPPILNSEDTKVTERTRNIVIDVTGTEPELMMRILNVVTTSVAERSSEPIVELVEVRGRGFVKSSPDLRWIDMKLSLSHVEGLLGVRLGADAVIDALSKMGLIASYSGGDLVNVAVPPYRIDVSDEVDLIEDVAIGVGYGSFEPTLPPPTHFGSKHPIERLSLAIRDTLVGMGLKEVVNFNLTSSSIMRELGLGDFVELANPKLMDHDALRNSLIPTLLSTAKVNQNLVGRLEAFEVGDVFPVSNGYVKTDRRVGILLMGDGFTLTDAIAIVNSLLRILGLKATLRRCETGYFIAGRSAEVLVDDVSLGCIGEVKPEVLVKLDVTKPVVVGELSISRLMDLLSQAT